MAAFPGSHGRQTLDKGIHAPVSWSFATEAARNSFSVTEGVPVASSGLTIEDVHKFCIQLDTDTIYILLSIGPPVWKAVTGLTVPTKLDKALIPNSTSGDGYGTALTITNTPVENGYVSVRVNGVEYTVGDGVKTTATYFSADGGTTARTIELIASGDELYWNGVVAGFDLLNSRDRVSLDYDI